ncbi:MAG TPA: hypothetical protein VL017_02675 [Devosia sp.]|nr:hypothetical protein [Devosia sp.]
MIGLATLDPSVFSGKAELQQPVAMTQLGPALNGGEVVDANFFSATVNFEGRLTLTPAQVGGYRLVSNDHAYGLSNGAALQPPPISFDIVQDEDHLYPVISGPLNDGAESWEVLIGPGHIWSDGGEGGRISFPITLKEPSANCLHNGLLSLAFDRSGLKPVAVYEFASETCAYFKFDLWGTMRVGFTPGTPADKDRIVARRHTNAARHLPVRPLTDLHTGKGPLAKPFGGAVADDPPTSYGFVIDGTVYASDCATRAGNTPLCADVDLPSFSTAKSIFAGIGLMRLEGLYPGVSQAKISDYVPECNGWGDVRFIDALDMATGRYDSAAYEADENSDDMAGFFAPADHAGKIAFACGHYPPKAAPATTFVYHTADTYVLGAAMHAFYKQKTGGDFYDSVLRPLWDGLHLSERLDYSQRTNDDARQPFAGYGLVYRRDDILRIAAWLRDDGAGLDPLLRAQALQRTGDRGLMAYPPDFRYQHGFWARNIAPVIGCDHDVWAPFMSGFGGITVALLPHDITFYFYGDSQQFDWTAAVRQANHIRRLCE